MHNLSEAQFQKSFLGPLGTRGPAYYWNCLAQGVSHHVCTDPGWEGKRDRTIPLYLRSDGVEIHRNISYVVVSASSALVSDVPSVDQQFFVVCFEDAWAGNETYGKLADLFHYFELAFEAGRIPYYAPLTKKPLPADSYWATRGGAPIVSDSQGRPKYFGAWAGVQGDLKEKVSVPL